MLPEPKAGDAQDKSKLLAQMLLDLGLIDEDQYWDAVRDKKSKVGALSKILRDRGIDHHPLLDALAEQRTAEILECESDPDPEEPPAGS